MSNVRQRSHRETWCWSLGDLLTARCEAGYFRGTAAAVAAVGEGQVHRRLRIGEHVLARSPSSGLIDGGLKIVVGLTGLFRCGSYVLGRV